MTFAASSTRVGWSISEARECTALVDPAPKKHDINGDKISWLRKRAAVRFSQSDEPEGSTGGVREAEEEMQTIPVAANPN